MKWFIEFLAKLFKWNMPSTDNDPIVPIELPPEAPKLPSRASQLYDLAKSLLGRHLSSDESVPWGVGCACAVSKVLQEFGIPLPPKGYQGTASLGKFLRESNDFTKCSEGGVGRIRLYETGTGNGKIRGHVFIDGKQSLMSNNSESGFWSAHWTLERAQDYYEKYGGFTPQFFEPA